jgi:N-carbamoylputrescine amidase
MTVSKDRLKVAVAQIACTPGEMEENLERHLETIGRAKAAGADILLFPELSLSGYQIGDRVLSVAMERHDPRILQLAEAAGEMRVALGFVEEGIAAQFHNTAAVLHRGEVAFLHRKLNLPTYGQLEEGKHFAAGRYMESFLLEDERWRCSLLVCADTWNPALVHLAAVQGATLLLNPVASAVEAVGGEFSNPEGWRKNLEFYSLVYGLPILFANHVGNWQGLRFWGGSRIMGAKGELLAEAGEEEALLVAELDYESLRQARYLLPTLRDSNLALIRRELARWEEILGVPPESRKV